MNNKIIGNAGETLAEAYFEKIGYTILKKNYRCRYGEIDIIARHGGKLVFAEVKTRLSESCGTGIESVDEKKREHIVRTAQDYILRTNIYYDEIEFHVIEIGINHFDNLTF